MTTIEVDLVRLVDGDGLREMLEANGFGCEVHDDGDRLCCRVTEDGDAPEEFGELLETWIAERGLPLIPLRLGDGHYLLRPPGD